MDKQDINEERLELALEAAGLDLWENDLITGEVTRAANKTFAELGYSEDEARRYINDLFTIIHPDDVSMVKASIENHLSGITAQYRCEFRIRAKSGAWVWYANYGKIMDRGSGKPGRRFIGVTFNIDDRKCKEEELAIQEQELRTLVENTPDTIARYDGNCCRIYTNSAFAEMADGGSAALLGKKPSEYPGGPNAQLYETMVRKVLATGENDLFELKWRGKDNREICSHIRLTAERDSSGKVVSVLGVGRDITELNEYRTELTHKELAKSRFLAAAGHDLRQPAAAANLFIDALKLTEPTPSQKEIINHLDQSMSTFNDLLDALLNISKLDSGMVKPEYTSINVTEVFNWLEQNFAPLAGEKHLDFRLYFPMKDRLVVRSDDGLIKSVLMNLVSNAIKFTPTGAILVSARRRGQHLLLQVWDTGMGITDQDVEHIFDEFYQINNPQRDRNKGLGLGLSIAKRALTLLESKITCHSQAGRGSVFGFRLPLDGDTTSVAQLGTIPIELHDIAKESFVRGKRFVIVENDTLVAHAMITWLEGMGGEVICFHEAEEALRHANIEDADCYIADYMLGDSINGIQFLNLIRQKLGKPVRAIVVTGDTSAAFIRHAGECDWPVLHKPINTSRLISELRKQKV